MKELIEVKREFDSFCNKYIESAETEWSKTDNQVDLAAATVAKIMQNKLNDIISSHQSKPVAGKGIREELKLLVRQCRGINYEYKIPASISVDQIEEILSHYTAEEAEPLAVLADRKGWYVNDITRGENENIVPSNVMGYAIHERQWRIYLWGRCGKSYIIPGSTYAEAEKLARAYLSALPDKQEGE